jgi:hypothetical protein
VDKAGNALDMHLLSLVAAKNKGISNFQPSGLILIMVFHYCGASFIDINLIRVYFHKPFVQLYDHLWACHMVIFPYHNTFQAADQALVRLWPGLLMIM